MTDLIESEDELLDPQPGPAAGPPQRVATALRGLRDRTPLGSGAAGSAADRGRRQRTALALLLAVAVGAGAGAAGVVVHSHDLARDQARAQDRLLLRLLGGGAALTISRADSGSGSVPVPADFSTPVPTDFTIALRNDGAEALEVTGVHVAEPGVDIVSAAPDTTIAPGESVALTTRVTVHCTAPDLPRSPSGVTVTVRTSAAKGRAAGSPTTLPLTFDAGDPVDDPTAKGSYVLGQPYLAGSSVTRSFYRLCGDLLTQTPPYVTAAVLPGSPSPQNPVIHYTLHIADSPDAARTAVPLAKPTAVPGVSAQADLTAAQQIGPDGLDVTITDRVTDCAMFGSYLSVRGGATQAAEALNSAVPVGLEPADPRFRSSPVPLWMMTENVFAGISSGSSDLQSVVLGQLAAVCPDM